jgi:predicted acetyltransferase
MSELPPAPDGLCHQGIELRYQQIYAVTSQPGYVPYYHFHIHDAQGTELGHINLRVGDTEHIHRVAGHIGYAIHSEHRGNGHAALACLALRPWVKQFYDEVWITCHPANTASRKTIEKIGGQYVDTVRIPEHECAYQNGERLKRRYRWGV